MDTRSPPEYKLELLVDRANVKDVVKGIVHTIFFHRYLTPLYPASHDVLDLTLPYITEDDFETLVEQRCNTLLRQLEAGTASPPSVYNSAASNRVQLLISFLEKKRRKSGWFGAAKADEETLWESWTIDFTLFSTPRSEPEAARNRRQMERSLQKAVMMVTTIAGQDRGHIPPITSNDEPFPHRIAVVTGKGRGG